MNSPVSPHEPAGALTKHADATPGERAIIDRIRSRLPPPPASVIVSVGDDAAVIVPERGAMLVLTTDALVEGVHFDRRFSTLSDVGYKSIAVNVSDIAAMGGTPSAVLISLMLPDGTSMAEIDALLDGILEMAAVAKVAVAGGNIARSPDGLIVDVTAVGHVRPRRILRRSGGRPGDGLYVTGTIGGAAAGLEMLRAGDSSAANAGCIRRHRRPEPRLRIGAVLGRARVASACMDLSDGLADAVRQIAEASGTGAVLYTALLPIDAAAHAWFSAAQRDPVEAALAGGDDYELLFTLPRKTGRRLRSALEAARGVALTRVGELTADPAIVMMRGGQPGPLPQGFTHF